MDHSSYRQTLKYLRNQFFFLISLYNLLVPVGDLPERLESFPGIGVDGAHQIAEMIGRGHVRSLNKKEEKERNMSTCLERSESILRG